MNYAAIWHEATQRFCFCIEPGRFRFRLQAGKGELRSVKLHSRDKYLPLAIRDTRLVTPMKRVACDGFRDYYEAELEFKVVCLRYCFELEDLEGNRVFYSNSGFTDAIPEDIERLFDCPQTLREEERFSVPGWAENKVLYQIFPSRFASHNPVPEKLWYQAPIKASTNLGGSLLGILEKLPYIRDLGVDILYLTPIFRSPSSHKYDTVDYYTIDPSFGTKEDLCHLVEKAHEMGLRVILDGVFNHTSPDFFAFADLKKNGADSPYRDWYYVDSFPVRQLPGRQNYKCFGYFWGMPKVNLRCPEAADYFTNVALYWLRETGMDGWRLDVADEISHSFWQRFRTEVKREFPEALIVGEVWHHAPDFLRGDQWDSVMNYPFYRSVLDFVADGSITASQFLGNLGFQRGNTHSAAYPLLWNLIGSHDTSRILYLCGENKARQKLASALQLLHPGMPMIYYGDEVAMTGAKDPDCRRGMLWDENRQDADMLRWYKNLLRLRREVPAITRGETIREEAWDDQGLIRITRRLEGQEVTLLFHGKTGTVRLPELAGKENALTGTAFDGFLTGIAAAVLL
jgi:glycosidase